MLSVCRRLTRFPVTVGVAVAAGLFLTPGGASAHTAATTSTMTVDGAPAGSTGSSASSPLTLLSQTAWVAPGQNFDLRLRVGSGTIPAAQLGISVAVYPCLSSVSAFDQSLSTSSVPSETPMSSTRSPLPLAALPAVDAGGVDLSMPVMVGTESNPVPSAGFTIDLTSAGDQCGAYPSGVYPVRVQLADLSTRQPVASMATHLVVTDATTGTQRLRVAVVVPVRATLVPSRSPTPAQLLSQPDAALDPPSPAATAALSGVVGALDTGANATVPVTLDASPSTLAALNASGHGSIVTELATMATDPSVHQFASAPFAPVNATSLVDAGLSSELAMQVTRGSQVLGATVTHPSLAAGAADIGTWITNDPLDTATVSQLATDGYGQLVLPSDSVTSSPSNGSAAEPFEVSPSHGPPLTAVASDADLSNRFTGSPGNPVLAAHQLVAELAQIYYEKPNDAVPRAVLAVPPDNWTSGPSFVDALTQALDANPIVEPVTVAGVFSTFGTTASCRGGCRLSAVATDSGLPAAAIRSERQRIDGFSSATTGPSARTITTQLGDLVLAAQSEDLRPAQQSGVLTNTSSAVDAQLAQLQVAGDRTVTLTSQQGTLPVTIVSNTPYPVSATLTLTSDKLLFPNGTTEWTQPITLRLPNNVVDVKVRARAPGVFKVDVVLHSPAYGLELSSGQVAVRSTATSVVGIVLSLGAVIVLGFWWFKTSRRRRALRRADELETTGAQPGPR